MPFPLIHSTIFFPHFFRFYIFLLLMDPPGGDVRPTESQLLLALPFHHIDGPSSSKCSAAPSCTACEKTFRNRGAMHFHMKKRHGREVASGEGSNDGTLDALLGIKRTENGAAMRFHCPVEGCQRRGRPGAHFASAKLLVQHFQKKHTEKRHRCPKCSARFALERDLRYHRKKLCPNAKCSAVRAEISAPISTSSKQMPNERRDGPKVIFIPLKFGRGVRFRPILPRFSVERRTVATQTDKSRRGEDGGRAKCAVASSQINFCTDDESSPDKFYPNWDQQNASFSAAVYETPQHFHRQSAVVPNELLRFQNVHCQTNCHYPSEGMTTAMDLDFNVVQCPNTATTAAAILRPPMGGTSSDCSPIYLPPLLTSSSTQTAAQMLHHQCSQTSVDPPSGEEAQSGLLLLHTQNSASTQTYHLPHHQQLLLLDQQGTESNCCWMDGTAVVCCSSVSAQTDLSWAPGCPGAMAEHRRC